MLHTDTRIDLLHSLGQYMLSEDPSWVLAKERAVMNNAWFTPAHIDLAVQNIVDAFLQPEKLREWMSHYTPPDHSRKVGIVMAGNIPLVGFHDFLCGFMSGQRLLMKLSSKDAVLLMQIFLQLSTWELSVLEQIHTAEMLKGCDAYIATGSNNSARYFEQYFAKYPHIIRRNRTSVAVLDGTETTEEIGGLGKDIFAYFGLGCRNVTQVCVPEGYDFTRLLQAFESYADLMNHNKYHNNYDYHLALYLLNRVPYLSNGSLLMVENALPFSAVSVLHYRYYSNKEALAAELKDNKDIQVVIGHGYTPFGAAQTPSLADYADGVDTMAFLCTL